MRSIYQAIHNGCPWVGSLGMAVRPPLPFHARPFPQLGARLLAGGRAPLKFSPRARAGKRIAERGRGNARLWKSSHPYISPSTPHRSPLALGLVLLLPCVSSFLLLVCSHRRRPASSSSSQEEGYGGADLGPGVVCPLRNRVGAVKP